jgi:hypothetical protein
LKFTSERNNVISPSDVTVPSLTIGKKNWAFYKDKQVPFWSILLAPKKKRGVKNLRNIYSCIPNIITCNWTTMIITVLFRYSVYFPYLILFNMFSTTTCKNWEQPRTLSQGSPHIVKTGQLDIRATRGKIWGDFWKLIQILTFLSPLPHVPLPFTKTNVLHYDLKKDGIKYWTSNPVWVTFQEHGSSFYVNIEEKVWLLVKKIWTWKDWQGWLKLRFLTEIGRFHWNQDEEVTHFACFSEPCSIIHNCFENWNFSTIFFFFFSCDILNILAAEPNETDKRILTAYTSVLCTRHDSTHIAPAYFHINLEWTTIQYWFITQLPT